MSINLYFHPFFHQVISRYNGRDWLLIERKKSSGSCHVSPQPDSTHVPRVVVRPKRNKRRNKRPITSLLRQDRVTCLHVVGFFHRFHEVVMTIIIIVIIIVTSCPSIRHWVCTYIDREVRRSDPSLGTYHTVLLSGVGSPSTNQ